MIFTKVKYAQNPAALQSIARHLGRAKTRYVEDTSCSNYRLCHLKWPL